MRHTRLLLRSLAALCAIAAFSFSMAARAENPAPAMPLAGERVPMKELLDSTPKLAAWLGARQPELAAAAARIAASEAAVDQSRVLPNPTLSATVGGMALGARNPSNLAWSDTLNVTVGLSETIELGKRGPRAQAAKLRRDGARSSGLDVLLGRVADARDALARVVYLSARQDVLSERLRAAQHVAALERVRLEHGDISGIDMDRLELEASAVDRELSDNRAELEASRADCAALLRGDCDPTGVPMDSIESSARVASLTGLDDLVRERPDIKAAKLSEAASRTDATLYRRLAIPDPTVGVAYTRDFLTAAGNQANTVAATLSLPLPLFDHGQHLARQAEAQAAEFGLLARAIEVRALADARSLVVRLGVLDKKLQTLTTSSIPRAESVLKASENAYQHGQLSLTDLLLVRREHASLLLDAIETRYALFGIRNTLHRTLGLGLAEARPAFPAPEVTQ